MISFAKPNWAYLQNYVKADQMAYLKEKTDINIHTSQKHKLKTKVKKITICTAD